MSTSTNYFLNMSQPPSPYINTTPYNPFVFKEETPPLFDASGRWESFIACFEKVAEFNDWNQYTKCRRLIISLRGDAVEYLDTLTHRQTKDYTLLKHALSQRFSEHVNPFVYEQKFYARCKQRNETFAQYSRALQSLAEKALPKEHGNLYYRLVCHQFIQGLPDRAMMNQLLWE